VHQIGGAIHLDAAFGAVAVCGGRCADDAGGMRDRRNRGRGLRQRARALARLQWGLQGERSERQRAEAAPDGIVFLQGAEVGLRVATHLGGDGRQQAVELVAAGRAVPVGEVDVVQEAVARGKLAVVDFSGDEDAESLGEIDLLVHPFRAHRQRAPQDDKRPGSANARVSQVAARLSLRTADTASARRTQQVRRAEAGTAVNPPVTAV